jgi:hypothetical protein
MTPEQYISGIQSFIETTNIDDIITKNLITEFHQQNPLPP